MNEFIDAAMSGTFAEEIDKARQAGQPVAFVQIREARRLIAQAREEFRPRTLKDILPTNARRGLEFATGERRIEFAPETVSVEMLDRLEKLTDRIERLAEKVYGGINVENEYENKKTKETAENQTAPETVVKFDRSVA